MTKRNFLTNISWLFIDKVIRIFGGLLVGVWVARYLGPADYGLLNFALAYTSFFVIFVQLGLDQILVRELVKHPALEDSLMGTAFYMKLGGAFLAIGLIAVSLLFLSVDTLTKTAIMLISFGMIFQSFDVIDIFFQSKVLSKYVVIARSSVFIILSIIKVLLIMFQYEVTAFILTQVAGFVLTALFLLYLYLKQGFSVKNWKFHKKVMYQLLLYGWSLALSGLIITIYTKIDQVMIGTMLNNAEVGIYSVAVTLSSAWLFVPTIFSNTFMPYFVNLKNTDYNLYRERLIQLYSLMFWLSTVMGIMVLLFGKWGIKILYGDAYSNAYLPLVLMIWNGIFISQAVARGIWLISENLQRYRLYNNLFAVTLNVIANILLIPKYGINGAAVATLLTQGLGTWVFPFVWKPMRQSNTDMLRSINPIFLYNAYRSIRL